MRQSYQFRGKLSIFSLHKLNPPYRMICNETLIFTALQQRRSPKGDTNLFAEIGYPELKYSVRRACWVLIANVYNNICRESALPLTWYRRWLRPWRQIPGTKVAVACSYGLTSYQGAALCMTSTWELGIYDYDCAQIPCSLLSQLCVF